MQSEDGMQVHAERRKSRQAPEVARPELVKIGQEEPDILHFILIFFISHKSKRKEGREDRRQRKKGKEREGSLGEAGVWPRHPH